jgi:SAM-dependent methyltransferase
MSAADSTQRFSDRVEHYVRSRPNYPDAFYEFLWTELGLTPDGAVADIGSGTGISARPLLAKGNTVYGIEPNGPMRQAAERGLAGYANFRSIDATAEATTLPAASVDLILAAQAFHWFDRDRARAEFARILKPGGWVVLVWNERSCATTNNCSTATRRTTARCGMKMSIMVQLCASLRRMFTKCACL